MWASYSTDQKNFPGHMFNIKLEGKSNFVELPLNYSVLEKVDRFVKSSNP